MRTFLAQWEIIIEFVHVKCREGKFSFYRNQNTLYLILRMCSVLAYKYWLPEGICLCLDQNSFSIWKRRQLKNQILKHFELHCLKPYDPLHLLSEWHELHVSPVCGRMCLHLAGRAGGVYPTPAMWGPTGVTARSLGQILQSPVGGQLGKSKVVSLNPGKGGSHPN